MHHRIQHLDAISPAELDRFLREGWYRMGQTMITCRFVVSDEKARGVLWTRTRLHNYTWSRSNRKLMRRNRRRYRVQERPLVIDEEHEDLYRRYLAIAPGNRSATLSRSLMGPETEDRFDTREVALFDEDDRLIGFSVFDVGDESLQSIMGVYDPDYQHASLGYWSLLLEVEHAMSLGLRYHYAGYVVPLSREMDYKLRVGQMEFLDPDDHCWRPWEEVDQIETPAVRLERVLSDAQLALTERGVPASLETYRWFEAPAWSPALASLLSEPRVVMVGDRDTTPLTLITWSFDERRYELLVCVRVAVQSATADGEVEIEMWLTQQRVELSANPREAADAVARWWLSTHRET